jgi:hypothetical protein
MLHAMAFGNFLTDFCRRCSASLSRQGLRALGAPSEYGAALSRIRTHTQRDLDLVTGFIEPQGITAQTKHINSAVRLFRGGLIIFPRVFIRQMGICGDASSFR